MQWRWKWNTGSSLRAACGPTLPQCRGLGRGLGLGGSIESAKTIDNGRIFALSPPAIGSTAWSYSDIYRCTGGADANPNFITVGPDGALYGGTNALLGEIYRLAPGANGWTEQILYAPANTSPLAGPAGFAAPLAFAPDGSIYGASNYGPSSNANEGTIFHLIPPSAGNAAYSASVIFLGNAPGTLALQLPNAIFAQSVGTQPSRLLLTIGRLEADPSTARKHFFLKKEAKTFDYLA